MQTKLIAAACACMALAACTTDVRPVRYHSTGAVTKSAEQKTVGIGSFSDARGVDPSILCQVRNGYGMAVKTVNTDKPVSEIVRAEFADALAERNFTQSASAPVSISGTITKLGCDYLMSKSFAADIQLAVYAMPQHVIVYQQTYNTHRSQGGAGAGVLADIDGLTKIEEEVISQTIDKAFTDNDFIAAISGVIVPPGQTVAMPAATDERLQKLDELKAKGLISDSEYAAKRKEILDSL
jgi:hypothetical protein